MAIKHDTIKSALHVKYDQVQKFGVSKSDVYYIDYMNSADFPIDCDNFTFETRVKNSQFEDGFIPNDIIIILKGNKILSHSIQFLTEGSHKWTLYAASEIVKTGEKEPGLSVFGTNLNEWRTVRLEVKNKIAKTYLDNRLIYTQAYLQPIGLLKILSITFKGSGWIDFVKLKNAKCETILNNDF